MAILSKIDQYLGLLREVSDAAHDVLKSYPLAELYEYDSKDEPLTNEQLLAGRLLRLNEAIDAELEFGNLNPEVRQ